jgi:hypothetical protein
MPAVPMPARPSPVVIAAAAAIRFSVIPLVPRSAGKTPHLGVLAGDLLPMNLMVTDVPGGEAPAQALACATVIGWQRPASSLAP